jgi:hypothetical protein
MTHRRADGFLPAATNAPAPSTGRIPNSIWTYWDGDVVPDLVERCMETWRAHNPTYRITVLRPGNLRQHLRDDLFAPEYDKFRDNPARFSDLVRLHALTQHGGIWMDASIICNAPLDWVHTIQSDGGYEFIGYYSDKRTNKAYCGSAKVVENWFFACFPGSRFVTEWRDEFMRIREFANVDAYVEALRREGVNFQGVDIPNYLAAYLAAQKLLQKGGGGNMYRLHLIQADATAFRYISEQGWDGDRGVDALMQHKYDTEPIVKLTATQRHYMSGLKEYPDYFKHRKAE